MPCYSIAAYNKHKCYKNPKAFTSHDFKVCRQVELLNTHIRTINSELGQTALGFDKDITRGRKDTDKHTNKQKQPKKAEKGRTNFIHVFSIL